MKGSRRKGEPWARTQRSGVPRRRAALGAPQHSGRSDAPGSACGSPAARPLCWWRGEVSHPEPEPDERPSAKKPGNEEGGKPVPGRLEGGEKSAGRGGAREAQSPQLLDGVARSSRPERTDVRRGKTCGRNFLPRERKAGEKEAGRDLKCLSNSKNTPKHPFQEMR